MGISTGASLIASLELGLTVSLLENEKRFSYIGRDAMKLKYGNEIVLQYCIGKDIIRKNEDHS